jgi:hypothetical protein
MLDDVRGGIWSEIAAPTVKIDAFRRELQRSYVTIAGTKVNPPAPAAAAPPAGGRGGGAGVAGPARTTSDVQAMFRSELRALDADVGRALPRVADRETRAHLEDVRERIKKILNPKE